MNRHWLSLVAQYSSVVGFMIGLPMMAGAYYESWRVRQEARRERQEAAQPQLSGVRHRRRNLHQPGASGNSALAAARGRRADAAGDGVREGGKFLPGAYLVESVEHIYTPVEYKGARPCEARLTKAVAHVTSLNPLMTE